MFIKGHKPSPESTAKRVANRAGYRHSQETIEKIRKSNTGKRPSAANIEAFRIRMKGRIPWNKGTSKCTREHLNETAAKWVKNNREKRLFQARRSHLKKAFGLTPEDFNRMVLIQDNKCAICLKEPTPETDCKGRTIDQLVIDHNHETGQVRGLLCRKCNNGLGLFKENSDSLIRAVKYLDQFKEHKI